jgi:hypothetical protein
MLGEHVLQLRSVVPAQAVAAVASKLIHLIAEDFIRCCDVRANGLAGRAVEFREGARRIANCGVRWQGQDQDGENDEAMKAHAGHCKERQD